MAPFHGDNEVTSRDSRFTHDTVHATNRREPKIILLNMTI